MKSKFLCFRPIGIETESEPNDADCFGDRAFTCITIPNYKDAKITAVAKSPVLDSESLKSSKISIKSHSSRSFSAVLKAVLFEISLRKKASKRKAPPQLMLGLESSDSNPSKSLENSDSSIRRIKRKSSTTPKTLSDNKLASKTQSKFSKQRKQRTRECTEVKTENKVISNSSSNSGLLLILIALSITVFYGRLCAILFTSLCLYFLPRRSIWEKKPENVATTSPEKESSAGDNRKRVIMEGLLERNHQRRGQ